MKPFAALDEVFNTRAIATAPARDVAVPAGDFQPLFATGALGASSTENAAEDSHAAPQIELIETEGRVQQIVVTCRCGERTVLDCTY
jgi:hypothetical protein